MPLRNPKPITLQPQGCSDATDGGEAFPGAMSALTDLVPSLTTKHQWVARPAARVIDSINGGGNFISGMLVVGDIAYGMVSNGATRDVPFAYNLQNVAALTVLGAITANTPNVSASSGDWTPPILAQVGSRIMVTHPGFTNSAISATTSFSFTSNPVSGVTDMYGQFTLTQAGDIIANPNTGTPVSAVSVTNGALGQATNCAGLQGQSTFTVASVTGISCLAGMTLTSLGNLGIFGTVTSSAGSTVTWNGTNPHSFGTPSPLSTGPTVLWGGSHIVLSAAPLANANSAGKIIFSTSVTGTSVAGYKFGWFDISNASIVATGNLINTSPVVSMVNAFGIQPGLTVTAATGIASSTTVININEPSISLTGVPPNAGDFNLTVTVTNPNLVPLPGMTITGPGIIPGTVVGAPSVIADTAGTFTVLVPLSLPAAGAQGLAVGTYLFTGLVSVLLNTNATTTTSIALTFTGGSPTVPLWGAGDTAYNPLPSVPVGVAGMAQRAYFACGTNGVPFSDSGLPSNRTFPSQAVGTGDGLAITAVAALPLSSPITGGSVQSVIIFAGAARMYQITGDQATNNLALNAMNIATGTTAPLSIIPTTLGLAFISPEGMRIVQFSGQISEPFGNPQNGAGISYPFVNVNIASRICGASNSEVIRYTVTPKPGSVDQEWVYYISKQLWTGPHSFTASLIQPWRSTFVAQPLSISGNSSGLIGNIWNAKLVPVTPLTYLENGVGMTYKFTTVLFPDNEEQFALAVTEAAIWFACQALNSTTITVTDETGTTIDTITLTPTNTTAYMRTLPLGKQWQFRNVKLSFTGNNDQTLVLGRIALKYQQTGYQRYLD